MADAAAEASTAGIKQRMQNFIQQGGKDNKYQAQLTAMMTALETRYIIDINELRAVDKDFADDITNEPSKYVPVIEGAIKELVLDTDADFFNKLAIKHRGRPSSSQAAERKGKINVGFKGNFGLNSVTPRTLLASHLPKMVAVEGIVTRATNVRHSVVESVHHAPKSGEFQTRQYRDATDLTGIPTGSVYPTKDDQGNLLETEFGLSTYKDTQSFAIQEMPESAPLGQLSRSVDVIVDGDLVNTVKPGDKVCVVGIYRALTGASAGSQITGVFRTVLLANYIRKLGKDATAIKISARDTKNIKQFAKEHDPFKVISRSLAPSIYGHRYVKQAMALMLVGGVEHTLANGTHIRGDINILMVGDPSTAKSQLLRSTEKVANPVINTTGKGSSGVGLTAAVTTDPETGERRIEAGAMVLAADGIVCIDEFDKMNPDDRVTMHEVMEQQTVTIAKAGMHVTLNASCSVFAAANPVYGRFNPNLSVKDNVRMPDAIMSRFDSVFIIRDIVNKETDKKLGEHVLRMHRYQRAGQEGKPVPLDAKPDDNMDEDDRATGEDGVSPVWMKYNPILHGGAAQDAAADAAAAAEEGEGAGAGAGAAIAPKIGEFQLLTQEFIRKYITYVKDLRPVLSEGARAEIVNAYDSFRQDTMGRATVVTARTLETIIRYATARAKYDQRTVVKRSDVQKVVSIMQRALYADSGRDKIKRQEAAQKKKDEEAAAAAASAGGDNDDDDDADGDGAGAGAGSKRGRNGGGAGAGAGAGSSKMKRSSAGAADDEAAAAHNDDDITAGGAMDDEDYQGGAGAGADDDDDDDGAGAGAAVKYKSAAEKQKDEDRLAAELEKHRAAEEARAEAEDAADPNADKADELPEPSCVIEEGSAEYKAVLKSAAALFSASRIDVCDLKRELWPHLKQTLPEPFRSQAGDLGWAVAAVTALEHANKVMYVSGMVHLLT